MAVSEFEKKRLLGFLETENMQEFLSIEKEPENHTKQTPSEPRRKTEKKESQETNKYSTISISPQLLSRLKIALLMHNESTGRNIGMGKFIEKLLEIGFPLLDSDAATRLEATLKK